MIHNSYKVTYRVFGNYHLYGYADTLSDALALDEKCHSEGWLLAADISIEDYDELMMAVSVIVQDLYRLPNRSFV